MIEGFLLGVIATASLAAFLFFLRFWRHTQDQLFLAFSLALVIQGLSSCAALLLRHPNEGSPWIYVLRLLTFLAILVAIVSKNRRSSA
jgi:CDP-diglyceride synthetase